MIFFSFQLAVKLNRYISVVSNANHTDSAILGFTMKLGQGHVFGPIDVRAAARLLLGQVGCGLGSIGPRRSGVV